MPRIKLTDKTLKILRTEKSLEEFIDEDFRQGEFGVRVSAGGRRAFFLRYRVNGKRRRLPLGSYPGVSLAQARSKALESVVGIEDGKDPAKTRQERRRADTVGALFEAFMAQKESSFARTTFRNYWSMWKKDCEKFLGDMKANDVERRHVVELLDTVEARTKAPHMVNRTRTMLMSLFNWAVSKDRCKYNPVLGVPKAQKRELPGERFLSRDEIRKYWECSGDLEPQGRVYWRMLLLLALRPGEVMKLRWDWIDGEVLTIPASVVKNRREHKLYLSDSARLEIESLRRLASTDYLFPSPVGESHRTNITESHVSLSKAMGILPWTARDIRRTCETQMRTFLRDSEGISRVLNHDVSAIRRHYDKGDYFDRKREVLTRWAQWLKSLLESQDGKIFPFKGYCDGDQIENSIRA